MPLATRHFPVVWILSTGTEILQGHYADTNAQWLSARLLALGLPVARHMALPDKAEALRSGLAEAARAADLVIVSGGLGPTGDDLNRQAIAELWGCPLVEDAEAWRRILERFARRGRVAPENNRVQALVPQGCAILQNDQGTAAGFYLCPDDVAQASSLQCEQAGCLRHSVPRAAILALPGPPHEMRAMFDGRGAALITEQFCRGRVELRTLTLHTIGLAESTIDERVRDLFEKDPRVNFALLAGSWRVDVRLTLMGHDAAENDALAREWRELVLARVGAEHFYGEDAQTLEGVLGALLRARGQKIATAESCTGGLLAGRLTEEAGASDYFQEGFITYSNAAKTALLEVPLELLERFGAVSPQVAAAMAAGMRKRSGANWALSVTGIAGPSGGSAEKPVGLVYAGLATPDGRILVTEHRFIGDRPAVRLQSVQTALELLRRAMMGLEVGPLCQSGHDS